MPCGPADSLYCVLELLEPFEGLTQTSRDHEVSLITDEQLHESPSEAKRVSTGENGVKEIKT